MRKNIRTQLDNAIGKAINGYYKKTKPIIDDIKFKERYQGRIIDCMVGEVDDDYIATPETDEPIVKLEHSKEGVVSLPSIKGKTILVDADGNETDTPAEGCRLVSVGEEEDNKLIILSKNKNLVNRKVSDMGHSQGTYVTSDNGGHARPSSIEYLPRGTYIFSIENYDVGKFVDAIICIWKEDLSTSTWRRVSITKPFEILEGEVGFTWYGSVPHNENISGLVGSNIQLEIGTIRTSYVEPKSHKTEILLDAPLRSLPNGVYDEIVDNKRITRVGCYTTTGNEHWYSALSADKISRYYACDKKIEDMKQAIQMNNQIADIIKIGNPYDRPLEDNFWVLWQNSSRLRISKENMKSIEEILNYIKTNPITVLYELEEPIETELPNGITLQGYDDGTMYIENKITPTVSYKYNARIPYKEDLIVQKEEVSFNTDDIEMNIIPYLMDMEFNLMLMEDK